MATSHFSLHAVCPTSKVLFHLNLPSWGYTLVSWMYQGEFASLQAKGLIWIRTLWHCWSINTCIPVMCVCPGWRSLIRVSWEYKSFRGSLWITQAALKGSWSLAPQVPKWSSRLWHVSLEPCAIYATVISPSFTHMEISFQPRNFVSYTTPRLLCKYKPYCIAMQTLSITMVHQPHADVAILYTTYLCCSYWHVN